MRLNLQPKQSKLVNNELTNDVHKPLKDFFAESSFKGLSGFEDMVLAKTLIPMCSSWDRNAVKNLLPSPPLDVAISANFPLKASRQFFDLTVIQVIAFDKTGGTPPLYSGPQNIKP